MTFSVGLKDITKDFNGTRALDNISLEIRENEILGLLGPNGAGKTTLMRIMALIEKPSRGEVFFNGERVTQKNMELMRLRTTMIFQKSVLLSTDVYGNVAYGLKIRRVPKRKIAERVREALKQVKLEGYEKRQAKKLSGGEQQRVALARALVLDTEFLLLDEPTANLDPNNASIIEEAISNVNRRSGTTVVMATHNMFQAKNLPHRIAIMENGRISEVGSSTEVFGRLSKTLASFAALENTFTGEAKITEEGTALVDMGNNFQIETTAARQGPVSIFISPEDIILSKNRLESSARNVLRGKIVRISDLGSVIRLDVDVGRVFIAQITKRSFVEMGLNLNAEVYVTFKASSVQVI